MLMLHTGLRVSEVSDLCIRDISISPRKGEVIVRGGKGEKFGTKTKTVGTLTERERTILRTFRTNPQTSLAGLGRVLGVSKTTAAGLVKNLIVAGHLRREGRWVYVLDIGSRGRGGRVATHKEAGEE